MFVTLGVGIGMIISGIGIGARNIYNEGRRRAFKNEKIMSKMIKEQKVQINQLIEQNFEILNGVKKNADVLIKSTFDLFDDVSAIHQAIDGKMKEINNKVCDFVMETNSTINSFSDKECAPGEVVVEDVDVVKYENNEAESLLADAMVDAGEDEELARLTAEAIREEEDIASQKRYKAAKKGGKK